MSPDTKQALTQSISHWRQNMMEWNIEDVSIASGACALCNLFRDEKSRIVRCEAGCPVFLKTGYPACEDSPYDEAASKFADWINFYRKGPVCQILAALAFHEAARLEYEFLLSLQEN